MIGAIIGDIVGSRFEFDDNNIKTKEFEFFHEDCEWTDDSLMTVAVAAALMKWRDGGGNLRQIATESMRAFARAIPCAGYGGRFADWLFDDNPKPYNSWGNGSAMRVSACGWIGTSLDEVKSLSLQVTDVTHNHPEGIKGAEATAVAIWLARQGWKIPEIRAHVVENYYPMDFTLDEIRPTYHMDHGRIVPGIGAAGAGGVLRINFLRGCHPQRSFDRWRFRYHRRHRRFHRRGILGRTNGFGREGRDLP